MRGNESKIAGLYLLAEEDFPKVKGLLAPLSEHLAPHAVIAGAAPGKVYVDDPGTPHAVFIHVQQRFYLAGDPDQNDFNAGLYRLFDAVIYPTALAAEQDAFVLYYAPGWATAIKRVILRDKDPIPDRRHTYAYTAGSPQADWRARLKPGDAVRPVDAAMLANDDLEHIDDLRDEVLSEAPTRDIYLQDHFGVCLVRDDQEILGWALSEYNLGKRCEVGIETVEAHRQQGIATITGGALVETALNRGITHIGWHCWASNAGSVATALRLGFDKVEEGDVYFTWFDRTINLAVNGNMHFFRGEYAAAMPWYRRAMERDATPWWCYWNAARSAASLGEKEQAMDYLKEAIAGGFRNVEAIQASEHLTALHSLPAWQELLETLASPHP